MGRLLQKGSSVELADHHVSWTLGEHVTIKAERWSERMGRRHEPRERLAVGMARERLEWRIHENERVVFEWEYLAMLGQERAAPRTSRLGSRLCCRDHEGLRHCPR